ncbi:hypothetical protein DY000_02060696 [Brassica cretica]|uniref:Uncharacterized protein n=1 Tax=Brassica cretica TaxID=69181 RepID=A0ABQ7B0N9_BRACR|nr:hypothetical protein DY000_02060696 [Brassica cretica]
MRSSEVSVFDFVATALSARNHSVLPPLKYIVVYSAGCATYVLPLHVAKAIRGALAHLQAPLTQATVNVYLLNTFRHLFTVGSPIPQERFRFCNDELLGLANTNTHLPGNPLIFLENMSLINRSTPESWMRIKEHGLTESFLRACPIGIMPDGSG